MPQMKSTGVKRLITIVVAVAFMATALCCAERMARHEKNICWWNEQNKTIEKAPRYEKVSLQSFYLPMRDGVKIALDLYLPDGLKVDEKLPTVLIQTRYVRRQQYRWPFNQILHGRFDKTIETFVKQGYAWVFVDARGSGASYGTRPHPYSEDEVKDGGEIVDWIIKQPWSNGKVGTIGNSYTGGSALFLATLQHPAVTAVMPRYAMFDLYSETVFPGGVHLEWLSKTWSTLADALDTNELDRYLGAGINLVTKGVHPVDGDEKRKQLMEALEDHKKNGNIHNLIGGITFRDDHSAAMPERRVDDISPAGHLDRLNNPDASYYFYTGWYDASFLLSEIHLFMNVTDSRRKLTIGPWDHGGYHNISPFAPKNKSIFNHDAESLRFFDYHLQGSATGIYDESVVHYFTMGEEKWHGCESWPPPGYETVPYYLNADGVLSMEAPEDEKTAFDPYTVDFTAATGSSSRWDSLVNIRHRPIRYPNRKKRDRKLKIYTSEPLEVPTEVTGHPIVELYVSSTATDGNFFVYLEDVTPKGKVYYVTEGLLRAVHRKLSDKTPPYEMAVPYRTFERADAMPLVPQEVAKLEFDLYPTSYLFKAGHRIRIALAGADEDHFEAVPDTPPDLRFYRDAEHPSQVRLPIRIRNDLLQE